MLHVLSRPEETVVVLTSAICERWNFSAVNNIHIYIVWLQTSKRDIIYIIAGLLCFIIHFIMGFFMNTVSTFPVKWFLEQM